MAKHRAARSRKGMLTLLVGVCVALGTLSPAGAGATSLLPLPQNKHVAVSNADFQASCQFTVKSVNPTTYVVSANGAGQVNPRSASGYVNNIFSKVECDLYTSDGATLLDTWVVQGNNPYVSQTGIALREPYSPSYILCVTGYVKLRNGDDSGPVAKCG